jgi:uncharacterized protein
VDTSFLNAAAHRPWPLPSTPWIMRQSWHNLLFAHWPLDAAVLRDVVPHEFEIDRFDGRAWLGVVPFEMRDVAPRAVPAVPWLSAFPELNVRTYVTVGGKPGVYFFSLDAGNPLAVHAARLWLNLPYFAASMAVARDGRGVVSYRSHRKGDRAAEFVAAYYADGPVFTPRRGTLEYFLTERYCLYGRSHRQRPYRLEIHHVPWPLRPARADLAHNSMAAAAGLVLPSVAPLLHFVARQDMVAWAPQHLR